MAGVGLALGSGGGSGARLLPAAATFTADTAAGTVIATLRNPFHGATGYAVVGATPAAVALSGASIVRTSATTAEGASFAMKVRATSADGAREIADTIVFSVIADSSGEAPAALAYLPALATGGASYQGVWSNERLIEGFAGALANAAGDFGAGDSGLTTAAVAAARGSADAVRVAGWYDQSGNGHAAIAPDGTAQPAMREDVLIGGRIAMAFDGIRGDARGQQTRQLIADGLALAQNDCTFAYVIDPTVSVQEQYYWACEASDGSKAIGHLQYFGAQFGGVLPDVHGDIVISNSAASGGDFQSAGRKIATVPQVMIVRAGAAGTDVFIDGTKIATLGASGATTLARLRLGGPAADSGLGAYFPNWRCGAFVAIAKAVNDADVAAITAALMSRFAIPSSYDAVVVEIGTSRTAGGALGTVARNKGWFEREGFGSHRIKSYNLGRDGIPLSTAYANRASYDAEVYAGGLPVIYVIDDVINDLGGLGASSDPAAIYTMIGSYCAALKGLGGNVKTIVATTMPQVGNYSRSDAAIEADRTTLNAAIRANAAGADAIADPAADTTMGAYPAGPNDSSLYGDHLHETSAGYALLAPYSAAAIVSALP